MSQKKTPPWKIMILSLLLTAVLYVGGVVLITFLTVQGYWSEERVFPALTALALLSALIGGIAAGRGKGGFIGGLSNAALFGLLLALLSFACWQGMTVQGIGLLSAVLAGGVAAGLMNRKVGKRHKKQLVKSHKKARSA